MAHEKSIDSQELQMQIGGPRFLWVLLSILAIITTCPAQASDDHPLQPADTSSPRATLQSFVGAVDEGLKLELKAMLAYLASDRLYSDDTERTQRAEIDRTIVRALETLDLSGLPSGFREPLAVEHLILLSEVLSRLDLPDFESIPDHKAMKAAGAVRWTIPNTRIEIHLIEEGPRRGEYLFSSGTVAQLGEFFGRVEELPYKSGMLKEFVEGVEPYTTSTSLYDIYRDASSGLGILPDRWMLQMPEVLNLQLGGVSFWKWIILIVYVSLLVLLALLVRHACRRFKLNPQWQSFFTALVIAMFSGMAVPLYTNLHISGGVLYVAGTASVAVFYVAAAWAAFIVPGAISEAIIRLQRLRSGAIDSQLIRLGARLIGLTIAIALLIEGANELGFPAYSVLAGLGIGGLAVAFGARETLANLLGSIVIMFEKPFRSGHWIKVGEAEGTVEHVGFRSTRIRTFGDSLISIPNSLIVDTVIDNLGLRERRRQRFFVQIAYDTPREKVEQFVNGAREVIVDHPMTDKDIAYINLHDLGESALEILLYFHLRVPDYATELMERETILLRIMALAEELAIRFAYPTRTLHVDHGSNLTNQPSAHKATSA